MRAIFLSLVVANVVVLAFYLLRPVEMEEASGARAEELVSHESQLLVLLDELEVAELERMYAEKQRVQFAAQEALNAVVDAEAERATDVSTNDVLNGPLEAVDIPLDRAMCTYVGPFKALLPAEYFTEHLAALEVEASVEKVEVPGEPSFWVYQEPQASRKAALRRLHELQAKRIDSYVIPKGELMNGISFGLYNGEERAANRLKQVLSKGYEAKIKKVERSFEEIWVSLGAEEAVKVGQELWFELMNREDGLEKRQNFCPDVASS